MTSVTVVIPTYDEAGNLRPLVAAVRQALAGAELTIGVVDDDSPDGTGALADTLAGPDLWVIHRERKAGLAGAYVAGFHRALATGADYVLQMDADFSHDPADLPRLLGAAQAGADVVLGSRYAPGGATEGWSADRRLLSRAGCAYARALLGSPVRDLTGGLKCFRAAALEAIRLDTIATTGFAFQVETTSRAERAGLRVEELPITFHERRAGRSKLSLAIAAEALWRIPALALAPQHARGGRLPARHDAGARLDGELAG
jgi:dolichol-phosphate mannosyltransferase